MYMTGATVWSGGVLPFPHFHRPKQSQGGECRETKGQDSNKNELVTEKRGPKHYPPTLCTYYYIRSLQKMRFEEIFDLTADVFSFYNM